MSVIPALPSKNMALLEAAMNNNLYRTNNLLQEGADANYQDSNLMAPLHYAAMYGNQEMALALLEHGANVDVQCKDKYTPITYLLSTGYARCGLLQKVELIKILFAHGAKVHAYYVNFVMSYLGLALNQNQSIELFNIIMEQSDIKKLLTVVNSEGDITWYRFQEETQLKIFDYLLSEREDKVAELFSVPIPYGLLPFQYIINMRQMDLANRVLEFIDRQSNDSLLQIDSKSPNGMTAFYMACACVRYDFIANLLKRDIDINVVPSALGNSALMSCLPVTYRPQSLSGSTTVAYVKTTFLLLKSNVDLTLENKNAKNALSFLITRRSVVLSKVFAIAGCPIKYDDIYGSTNDVAQQVKNRDMILWLRNFRKNPRRLDDTCRIMIRRFLGRRMRFVVPKISEVPAAIRGFLFFSDLEQTMTWLEKVYVYLSN